MIINTKKGGAAPNIEALSVTANGTYTAPSGVDGYSPVTVDVPTGIFDPWEYANTILPTTSGKIYIALKPSAVATEMRLSLNATVAYGTASGGVFTQVGTITAEQKAYYVFAIPIHNEVMVLELSIANNPQFYKLPDAICIRSNLGKATGNGQDNVYSPTNCDLHYYSAIGASAGAFNISNYISGGMGAKEIYFEDLTYANIVNVSDLASGCNTKKLTIRNISHTQGGVSGWAQGSSLKYLDASGLKKISSATVCNNLFVRCRSLAEVNFANWENTETITNLNSAFQSCYSIEILNLTGWNMSNVSAFNATFQYLYSLQTIVLTNATMPNLNISFGNSAQLTDASLVGIANALIVSNKVLTLHATPKARLSAIMGTVTDGVFTADASGSTTLLSFINDVKGWSVA